MAKYRDDAFKQRDKSLIFLSWPDRSENNKLQARPDLHVVDVVRNKFLLI